MQPLRPKHATTSATPFNLSESSQRYYHGPADVKHVPLQHHERSRLAAVLQRTATPVQSIASVQVEGPILPPAYDAISNRDSRQP